MTAVALHYQDIGILILTGFGALWLLVAARFAGALDWRAGLGVGACAGALALSAVRNMLGAQQAGHAAISPDEWWQFWTVVAVMWLLILASVLVSIRLRRLDLILSLIALIVGLHFLPLARAFDAPQYYVTGAVIVVAASLAFGLRNAVQRQAATCLACGMTLWLTASTVLLVPR